MSKMVQIFYKEMPSYYSIIHKDNKEPEHDVNYLIDKINRANGGIKREHI